ncbi:MAG TPA: hypothetical protein VF266_14475, partial [Thermoanaerobaculia bacterium]
MPLPKSILCTSCKKTYPEGWKRCPYCGHDELRIRQVRQAQRYMEKKVREFEQRTGKSVRKDRDDRQQQPQKQRGPRPGQQPQKQRGPRPERPQQQQ